MVLCHCLLGSVYFGACTLSWDGNSRTATPPEAGAQTGTVNAQSTNTVCELVSALCGCVRTVCVWVCVGVSTLCVCGFAWVCPHCVCVGLRGCVHTVWVCPHCVCVGLHGCVHTVWVWVCVGVSTLCEGICMGVSALCVCGFAWVCPHCVGVGVHACISMFNCCSVLFQ